MIDWTKILYLVKHCAAPKGEGADMHKAMREVAPNDVILHFTDSVGITGISRAAAICTEGDEVNHT